MVAKCIVHMHVTTKHKAYWLTCLYYFLYQGLIIINNVYSDICQSMD